MTYLGNPPVNGVFKKLDSIAGSFNGSTTTFNLTSGGAATTPGLAQNLIISLGGVIQEPGSAFTINGSQITFTSAPATNTTFWGIQLGDVGLATTPNQSAMTTQVFTATAGQTTFTVAGGYTAGQIQIFENGVQLVVGSDVTASNGTTFVLTNAATAGDTLVAIIYSSFIVANAVAKSGDTMTGTLTVPYEVVSNSGASANSVIGYSNGSKNWYVGLRGDTSNVWAIADDSAFRVSVNVNGNVGIGGTPSADTTYKWLNIVGPTTSGGGIVQLNNSNSSVGANFFCNDVAGYVGTSTNHPFLFRINSGEVARFDNSGFFLIGTTLTNLFSQTSGKGFCYRNGASLDVLVTSDNAVILNRTGTDGSIQEFRKSATVVGSISVTGSATAYNTSSDYRLKENVRAMTDGLATVSALKPVRYDWISDKSTSEGFIAHELQEVIPQTVTGEKDAVNEDGSIKPQGVDYSKLVPHLVAACQELKAELDAAKARIAALEGVSP
jgi:hypothetical protein